MVIISWTTTWPSPTRLVYGLNAQYGQTAGDERRRAWSIAWCSKGCDPTRPRITPRRSASAIGRRRPWTERRFHVPRGVGPDGKACQRGSRSARPAARQETFTIPLAVRNPHAFAVDQWPITTGVPFAQGTLGSAEQVRLVRGEEEVPAQVQLTARWPDGSVKWLLVTFLASAPAAGQADYRLGVRPDGAAGRGGRGAESHAVGGSCPGTRLFAFDGVQISTGALSLRVDRQGNLADVSADGGRRFADNARAATVAEDPQGKTFLPGDGTLAIEESGPDPGGGQDGLPLARREGRASGADRAADRGLSRIAVDSAAPHVGRRWPGAVHRLEAIELPSAESRTAPGRRPWPTVSRSDWSAAAPSVYQLFDDTVSADPAGAESRKGRVVGSLVGFQSARRRRGGPRFLAELSQSLPDRRGCGGDRPLPGVPRGHVRQVPLRERRAPSLLLPARRPLSAEAGDVQDARVAALAGAVRRAARRSARCSSGRCWPPRRPRSTAAAGRFTTSPRATRSGSRSTKRRSTGT